MSVKNHFLNQKGGSINGRKSGDRANDGDGRVVSPRYQWDTINASVESTPLEVKSWWFLVSAVWLRHWQTFCQDLTGNVPEPGGVTTSDLIHPLCGEMGLTRIRENLIVDEDYVLVPKEAWNLLIRWYGLSKGSKAIARPVIEKNGEAHIEVDLPSVRYQLGKGSIREMSIPQNYTMGQLRKLFFCEKEISVTSLDDDEDEEEEEEEGQEEEQGEQQNESDIESDLYFVLSIKGKKKLLLGAELNFKSVQEQGLFNPNSTLLVYSKANALNLEAEAEAETEEEEEENDFIIPSASPSHYHSRPHSHSYLPVRADKNSGLVGLRNLGNTCFMNSALQCLSNSEALTSYFLSGKYMLELNRKNPIGTGGLLAEAYGELLKEIWKSRMKMDGGTESNCCSTISNSVDPSKFKGVLGRFESRFIGYHQQDSQELLSALLDRLHEDTNRISNKPYFELKDSDGRPDKILANETWNNHKLRNDSVIVDNFHGQFRSSVTCPICQYNSVTFDPFLFVSLPLPNSSMSSLEVTFVNGITFSKKMKIPLDRVHKTIGDLLLAMERMTGVPLENLIAAEVFNHEIYKVFTKDFPLCRINQPSDEIFIYLVEGPLQAWVTFKVVDSLPLLLTNGNNNNGTFSPTCYSPSPSSSYFAFPLLVKLDNDSSCSPPEISIRKAIESLLTIRINGTSGGDLEGRRLDWESLGRLCEDRLLGVECYYPGYIMEFYNDYFKSEFNVDISSMNELDGGGGEGRGGEMTRMMTRDSLVGEKSKSIMNNTCLTSTSTSAPTLTAASTAVTLQQCLDLFTMEEKLTDDELWYCKRCKDHQQAAKKMDIWRLPKILILHLKRFSYTKLWGEKISTPVEFPINGLDLNSNLPPGHSEEHPLYDLFAISNHFGGLGGGHYTAMAKNFLNQNWYNFDDSYVSQITDPEDFLVSKQTQKSAYLLFYQRRGGEE